MSAFFCFGDLRKLYSLNKKKIWFFTFFGFCFTFALISVLPFKYRTQALFKDASSLKDHASSLGMIKEMFKEYNLTQEEPLGIAVMGSRKNIFQVIERLGLQAELKRPPLERMKIHFLEHVYSLLGKAPLEQKAQVVKEVRFTLEMPLKFHIRKLSSERFFVDELQRSYLFGEKVYFPGGMFLLGHLEPGEWILKCLPKEKVIDRYLSQLVFKLQKSNKQCFQISFTHENRLIAKSFVDALMEEYQNLIASEHEDVSTKQLSYLEKRKAEVSKVFDKYLEQHASYLKENLGENGFLNLSQEIHFGKEMRKKYSDRLTELDLKELEQDEGDPFHLTRLRTLSLLKENLKEKALPPLTPDDALQGKYLHKLVHLNLQKALVPLEAPSNFLRRAEQERLYFLENEISGLTQSNEERGLRLEKFLIEERLAHEMPPPQKLKTLDLETASGLALEIQHEISGNEKRGHMLASFKERLERGGPLEVAAISPFLTDPFGQQLIQKIEELQQKLADAKNLLLKDKERLEEALAIHKASLKNHLEETLRVAQLSNALQQKRFQELNALRFELVNKEIFLLREEAKKAFDRKLSLIAEEKRLIEEKLSESQRAMQGLPEKWLRENKLKFQADMVLNLMEGISHLVEAKNVEYHLKQIESRPIDLAFLPLKPRLDLLLFFSFFGAFLAFVWSMGYYLAKAFVKGMPVSEEWLKSQGFQVLSIEGSEPQHLRPLAFAAQNVSKIALIGDPSYAIALGKLLQMMKKRVLLFSLVPGSAKKGWIDFIENPKNSTLYLRKKEGLDLLEMERHDSFYIEKWDPLNHQRLWAEIQKNYDHILLLSNASLGAIEALQLLSGCDFVIYHLTNETQEEIKNITHNNIIFIY